MLVELEMWVVLETPSVVRCVGSFLLLRGRFVVRDLSLVG
jgi:hypothetical protein